MYYDQIKNQWSFFFEFGNFVYQTLATRDFSLEKKALYFKWNFLKLSTITNFKILRESDRGESDVIYSLV